MRLAHGGAALAGLFLVALTLRPQIVGIGPLFPRIEDDLNASHAVVGLLGTIPVLCMGLFAPAAGVLAHRVGTRRAIAIAAGLIGVFGVLRAVVPSIWLVVLLTWPVGAGMGLGNALAAITVKERFDRRPAAATGVYTTGIQTGSTAAAALAVPIAVVFGGWRFSLVIFSIAALVLAAAWLAATRGMPSHLRPSVQRPRLPWRSPTAWLLVAIFGLMGSAYYGLNAWLPDAYVEDGWSEGRAGGLLAAMNLTAIPASFGIAWLSDRAGRRQPFLVAMSVVFALAALGLVAVPSLAWGWALLAGVSQGSLFGLVMTLPLDFEERADRVGALVGLMLGVGYTLAATSPLVLGTVRDATGSFDGPLWAVVAMLALLVLAVLALPRVRRVGAAQGAARIVTPG